MSDRQVVLVTGASAGFGRLMVETFARAGYRTYAAMRAPSGKNAAAREEIEALAAGGLPLSVVALDVTSDEEVAAAVARVLSEAGRIDVVINNAGVGLIGLTECTTVDQMRFLFETNVFSAQRLNRAVLPHMRARRTGLLVHVASTLGRMVMPAVVPYCTTKWALEALAEGYRHELTGTGVDSVIVEPGLYPTNLESNSLAHADTARAEGYGPMGPIAESFGGVLQAMLGPVPPSPQEVADAVLALVQTPSGERPLRTVIGRDAGGPIPALNGISDQIGAAVSQALGLAGERA